MIRKSELTKEYYKPSEVGTLMGTCQRVIFDMVRAGKLEALRGDTNRIMIPKYEAADLLDRSGLLGMIEIQEEMQSMTAFFLTNKKIDEISKDRSSIS